MLIHNAAAVIGPLKYSADKLELQMATNHIGPFLFTKLVYPKILAASTPQFTPRVVFVASAGHKWAPVIDFTQLGKSDERTYTATDAYGQSKQANVMSAMELSRRSGGRVKAYSLQPGGA